MARPKRARQATRRSWTSGGMRTSATSSKTSGATVSRPDERRAGPRPEHHLEAALEGEDLGIEARAGDDVGQQVLDVVEDAGLGDGVGEVEDLLLEQELLFVVEHGRDGSTGPARARRPGRPAGPRPTERPARRAGSFAACERRRPSGPRRVYG